MVKNNKKDIIDDVTIKAKSPASISPDLSPDNLTVPGYRMPGAADGALMWQLAKEAGSLDLNSPYAYIMAGYYFSETCSIAEVAHYPVGFATGYLTPADSRTLFIWQIAVKQSFTGRGVAKGLLKEILIRNTDISYLETTVTPGNQASRFLFEGLAREIEAPCRSYEVFPRELFPDNGHEAEFMYRIGPFNARNIKQNI